MANKSVSSPVVPSTPKVTPATPKTPKTPKTPTTTPKKPKLAVSKMSSGKPVHPKTSEMIVTAIGALKERGGSSLQAIKKYIASTYKVNSERQSTFVKKYIKIAVESGVLIQTKGKGAAGSFKLATNKVAAVKPKKTLVGKSATAKKSTVDKKAAGKKVSATAKSVAVAAAGKKEKKSVAKVVAEKKGRKSIAKAITEKKKTGSKGPAAKPPKPKTTKAKPAAKSPTKKAKQAVAKKTKPALSKTNKVAPKKATVSKK